jgi:16S rRNA (guanine527-N7)-methyltransferase
MSARDLLVRDAERVGVALAPQAAERLLAFEDLLAERALPQGMVSGAEATRVRERHVLDCLRLVPEISPAGDALDLGSGAGLPGVVVACALPDLRIALVEPRQRRAAFLELALERLRLSNASVIARPLEELTEPVDACLARALAAPADLWARVEGLLRPRGRLLVLAGSGSVPFDAPAGVRVRLVTDPLLESSGPLVIMARQ